MHYKIQKYKTRIKFLGPRCSSKYSLIKFHGFFSKNKYSNANTMKNTFFEKCSTYIIENDAIKIPENRSFQTALGTLLKVMTPLTVSFKSFQVKLKSTRFGFKDILQRIISFVSPLLDQGQIFLGFENSFFVSKG